MQLAEDRELVAAEQEENAARSSASKNRRAGGVSPLILHIVGDWMLNQGAYAPRSPNQVLPIIAGSVCTIDLISLPSNPIPHALPVPMLDVNQGLAHANRVRFAQFRSRVLIELCCHAANILYLLSYLVRDML